MTPVDLHHRLDGPDEKPVVVLSNSLGSTLAMWHAQMPALTSRFRVLRYDHRGHGDSPVPTGPYRLPDLAGDVLELLGRLHLDRVHFCGLSLGGMVGMWLAAHVPERVDRLVLCCTAARLGPPTAWAQRATVVRAEGTAAVADTVVGRWFTPAFLQANPDLVQGMRAMVSATPREGYASCCQAIETANLEPFLGQIGAPTLVLAGADDPATPPEHARRIATGIPGARVAVIDDAAHLANIQQADTVTRLLLEHLDPEGAP